jgi:acyl-CoA synthetase (AMP-forming)/AMP-acid ligase II
MNHLPNIIYYNVYGLAELAGRFFINKIDSNTPISSYESTGYNINGTHYSIHDSQLHVKSDFLFLGYIRNNSFEPSMESHPTGDLAYYKGENLFLYGRANDEIKVLGNKVALKHVENKIKNILNQDTAILISVPHPTFGNVLALLLKSEKALQRQVLIRKLRTDLSLHEIPHQFYYIDDIPFTQSLKIDRNKILGRISSLQRIS